MKQGACVLIPDGRIGRVRTIKDNQYIVRVRRITSKTHQFLSFQKSELQSVTCPTGWMSPEGYNRYLKVTLEKMKERNAQKKKHEK